MYTPLYNKYKALINSQIIWNYWTILYNCICFKFYWKLKLILKQSNKLNKFTLFKPINLLAFSVFKIDKFVWYLSVFGEPRRRERKFSTGDSTLKQTGDDGRCTCTERSQSGDSEEKALVKELDLNLEVLIWAKFIGLDVLISIFFTLCIYFLLQI